MNSRFFPIVILLSVTFAFSINAQITKSGYRIVRTITLTGDGGWDYLSVDQLNSRLFVSHGTMVNVADLKKGAEAGVVSGTPGVHGIAIANDLNKAFISCGRDTSVKIIDLITLKEIAKIKVTGQNPDAILYDQFSHKVFTFNGRSANSTVIDANENKVIGTIPLSGKPEFPQSDGKGKIYVNIEDKSNISVISATTLAVENVWPISPGEEPTGLALDNENHRLFSVCSNKLMVVADALNGKVITTLPIGDGCDGVAFDPGTKRIFASNGEGTITVVQQDGPDKYVVIETIMTAPGARTITVDRNTHHIYLPVADREGGNSRAMKPNTFRVLDVEPVSK
jgi:DNA-binding beta-propeller fold protein YncE